MSIIFNQYEEISDVANSDNTESGNGSFDVRLENEWLKKKNRRLKEKNKLLKKEIKRTAEEISAATSRKEKTFLSNIGDILLKVFPDLLKTAVTKAITEIVRNCFKHSGSRGWVTS